ncbi:hypothetical protein EAO71_04305 [Streptomyces sp. ms191]|nr:hypothetical protein EAO71_04305 [Streptomyces sp. ms191]
MPVKGGGVQAGCRPVGYRSGLTRPPGVHQVRWSSSGDRWISVGRILERLGVDVDFPAAQTCCGQPQYNTGYRRETAPLVRRTVDAFAGYDHVVTPSGSCAAMVPAPPPLPCDPLGRRGKTARGRQEQEQH